MHIGITVSFKHSVFSSGTAQTALALAELFTYAGDTCSFIRVSEETWWQDIQSIQNRWKISSDTTGFDRILEVEPLTPAQRAKAGCPCIWIVRKSPLFHDIEACVIPFPIAKRDLEGITETWAQEELCTADDIQYLELITKKPVRTVPFLWSAIAIETFRKGSTLPIWQQSYTKDRGFQVHICETNMSSTSSCLIPLCIFGESVVRGNLDANLKVHNGDHLKGSEFFQKNLWANVVGDIKGMTIENTFVGRQRIVELPSVPNTLLIAHSRFIGIRPYQLDALWCGIPLVHNSPLLCKIGADVERGYYPNNDISKACSAVESVTKKWLTEADLFTVRKKILYTFGVLSDRVKGGWKDACANVRFTPSVVVPTATRSNTFHIGFTDMWENFNPEYNFFTLLLQDRYPEYTILGFDASQSKIVPDAVLFGPFGSEWKSPRFAGVRKIHYTGENTGPVDHPDVFLNMGYEMRNDPNYIRLPLWILEVDWFHADVTKLKNPIPISLKEYMNPAEGSVRNRFCAFVVSNPSQPARNQAFHTLNRYKPVDSAGRLYNNVGTELFAGLGGGGGERMKVDFLKQFKFCLTYENAESPGYITEKIFHAKAAGCVPIYWGAPNLEVDFDIQGCIDARGCTSEELIARVKEVDENPQLWSKKASIPAISTKKYGEIMSLLSVVATRIMGKTEVKTEVKAEVKTEVKAEVKTEVKTELKSEVKTVQLTQLPTDEIRLGNTVFVTGCNSRFVDPLLSYWLPSVYAQKNVLTNIQVHVYLLDVSEEDQRKILTAFPSVKLFAIPSEKVPGFPDCWNPQHFLWKLWLLKESVRNITKGYPIIYMDTGVLFCRWPTAWLKRVKEEGICLLEDSEQDNRHWCNPSFCRELGVTEQELNDQQLWAGSIACIAGDAKAIKLFEDAWTLGKKPAVIVGEKWAGLHADKKPYGHRHDQSILSVLSKRQGIARFPLGEVYCHISLRHTYMKGLALYAHRGFFILNDPVAMGIDTTWVINLDRRKDRMDKFLTNNAFLAEKMLRFPAVDGKKMQLTPKIARMFASAHNISWRKGVMGCALSHMALWSKLVKERKEINTYFILEDDAVINSEFVPLFNHLNETNGLPADWDVIYLGGVLPPNRQGFESGAVERVSEYLGRVKENNFFGQSSKYFHFCAYSYILRRSGAEKLMRMFQERNGCWAPADHMICNEHASLNIYFTYPLLAGCYQDTDPRYLTSNFNVFGKEEYDSDLRNEDCFTEKEIRDALQSKGDLDIDGAWKDATAAAPGILSAVAGLGNTPSSPVIFHDIDNLFEKKWLEFVLGKPLKDIRTKIPIVVYQRPYCEKLKETLRDWPAFTLLHLSDERGLDPIDIYDWPACKGVVRNYLRPIRNQKVVTIPLGYHWKSEAGQSEAGQSEAGQSEAGQSEAGQSEANKSRDLIWSFIGAEHVDRKEKLQPFKELLPNKCVFQSGWNSPQKLGEHEVLDTLERSMCVPCPGGVEYETFRIYEALEAGAVPVFVDGDPAFLEYLKQWVPVVSSPDWATAARIVFGLSQRPDLYEAYRISLLNGWAAMKQWTVETARKTLGLRDMSIL
jgi:GR25 family glycosyltransferase involved in LPS biosynthesis